MSRSEREFIETGFMTEKTQEHRQQILAMDALFMDDDDRQQQEDEEHQQHEEGE